MKKRDFLGAAGNAAMLASLASLGALPVPVRARTTEPKVIRVGIRGGLAEELWAEVVKVGATKGLKIEPVVLSAAVSPNEALNNGDLEANAFQHLPFMREQIKHRGYKIVPVANTVIAPMAFYSRKVKRLEDLPEGARIGVTDDASNQCRALMLLRDHGLIRLREDFDPFSSSAGLSDIVDNPRKLKFTEAAAVILARSLPDLDAAAITSNFAYQAGLLVTRDGIAVEKTEHNPYVLVIAVRAEDEHAPWVAPLVASFQNNTIRDLLRNRFPGLWLPAF